MSFAISGYVLEPIRVGQANSPFTQTPDNYISSTLTFIAAYPFDESAPRNDYLVLVTSEGATHPGLLAFARFGWTKNEIVTRFGYAAQQGRFKPLPGAAVTVVGNLAADSNTNRLKVRTPVQVAAIPAAPYRLAVGSAGSGTTWTITIVANEAGFTSPPPGTVELAFDTGTLNWNTADLTTYAGQLVRFQQQQFFDYKDSTGNVGFAPTTLTDPIVILNPLPGSGQFPLLRFGFGFYLTTVEVANEGAFTVPPVGTVQWAANTGRLNFNPTDAANYAGIPVYYDGVLFATGLALPSQVLGDIAAPAAIVGLPPVGVDLIFSLPNASDYYQFPQISYVSSFSSGKVGVVEVDPTTGNVQFSASDQGKYAGESVTVTFGDMPIERGISIRLLRTPVNLDGQQDLKDVTAIYPVVGATWANPIIGSPQVFLPSTPIQDVAYPLTVMVGQGQGTFTSNDFPRLDVPSPPAGLGYYIDYDASTLFFAQRKDLQLVPILQRTSDVMLPDPLVLSGNVVLELETAPGSGIYTPLTVGTDALFDSTSGTVHLSEVHGNVIAEGTGAFTAFTTFTDSTANFFAAGVQPGHFLETDNSLPAPSIRLIFAVPTSTTILLAIPAPLQSGVAYKVRTDREILADRYFDAVELIDPSTSVERIRLIGTASNSPRLSVPVAYVERSGFRFGPASADTFATIVLVPDDGSFTTPPTGTVEISEETGNLNFAPGDLGSDIYWARELVPEVDYTMQPGLGLVQFKDRMLEQEEARITYTTEPPSTNPPTPPGPSVTEYARFLIRKEITQAHPAPTSTLSFNIEGRPVASTPPPAVFRGGRPQKIGIQCTVDTTSSTITFLADQQITNALPHGSVVNPNERVYIDYYVLQAVGGENTFTVLNPPLRVAQVNIQELDENANPTNSFTIPGGDYTDSFNAGFLLRIEKEQIYLIGSSLYDGGTNATTVTLYGNQTFQDSFTDPQLYVSSGPTPITSAPLIPAYFTLELAAFEAIARGSNTFLIAGDRTASYRTGVVLMFTDGSTTFTDFLQVAGASYDAGTDRTEVKLNANAIRQYVAGQQILNYSVRPVYEPPTTEAQTSEVPLLTEPYVVFRGGLGLWEILTSPTDYTIDDSGKVVFAAPLGPLEDFSIFYTGQRAVDPGINLRASYTSQVVPSATNGLLGQILTADFAVLSPDTFYYRVETMTNFRGEYAQEIKADASSGSSGPQTENASQPQLFEQGRKSLYFDEKHLANQDIIARSSLLFYNTSVNLLEAYLRALDGRVVGNNDGLFLFDGSTGSVVPPDPLANQIDDVVKVSNAPYTITFPPFAVTSIGTYRKYYLPGALSRFYPTSKNFFGVSAVTPDSVAGDEVLDTGSTDVTLVAGLHTRLAWAVLTESTDFSGPSTLKVDNADGSDEYARPPFKTGMKCVVQNRDGTFINDTASPVTVSAVSTNQLTVSGLAGTADVGTTIYRSPIDDSAQADPDTLTYYLISRDYSFNGENGQVTYVPTIAALTNTPLIPEQALSGKINLINTITAPLKFPALYGGISDDDGDLSFPIQTPDPVSEQNGYLYTEDTIIHTGTGLLPTITTMPFVGTGTINGAGTIITKSGGAFPAPAPQVNDLVRILTGTNANSNFRRVTAVTGTTVTVTSVFVADPNPFTFEVAVTASTVAGIGNPGPGPVPPPATTTTLNDAAATFLTDVKIGQTVVRTASGQRRQIVAIISNTELQVDSAFSATLAGAAYRISDSLATYGGTGIDYRDALLAALAGELTLYPDEQQFILDFLDQVFTDITTGATGSTTIGQPTLTDLSAQFLTDAVTPAYYVYIVAGADAGFYQIQSVDSETQLTMASNFPATLAGISYRVVKLFGVSADSVTALFTLYLDIAMLLGNIPTFQAKLAAVPVNVDTNAFAMALLSTDLVSRDTLVDARISDIPTTLQIVEDILASTDKLYDTRYTWIDTRINLESGLLVQQTTATANRIKAQADIYNQLVKLLAVEGA